MLFSDLSKKLFSENNPSKVKEEFSKDFIGFFENNTTKSTKLDAYKKFIDVFNHNIIEQFEGSDSNLLVEWVFNEFYTMNCWRPAKPEFDHERVDESPDSIVLFEDIQNYLYTVHQETFKMDILDSLFELLGKLSPFRLA